MKRNCLVSVAVSILGVVLLPESSAQVLKGSTVGTQTPSKRQVQANQNEIKWAQQARSSKLNPPKVGPKVANPHGMQSRAAMFSELQMQRQAVDSEIARMKSMRVASNAMPMSPQPAQRNPINARSENVRIASGVRVNTTPAVGTSKPTDASSAGSKRILSPMAPSVALNCTQNPALRVVSQSTKTFTPIPQYNLYTFSGCSFGDANPNNKAWIYAPGFHEDLQIQEWSDNSVVLMLNPNLSGVLDQSNVHLVLHRADGKEIDTGGFKFYAVREIRYLGSIPTSWVHVGTSLDNSSKPVTWDEFITQSPAQDSMATGQTLFVERYKSHYKTYPAADVVDFSHLAPGWTSDSFQLSTYNENLNCPGLITYDANSGPWNPTWVGDNIRVFVSTRWCSGLYPPPPLPPLLSFEDRTGSFYSLNIWVNGPRCTDPFSGQPDQNCMRNVQ